MEAIFLNKDNALTYKQFKRRRYLIENRERIRLSKKNLYKKYSNDYLVCKFCCKGVMLFNAMNHLKGQRCRRFQECCGNYEELYLKYLQEINTVKAELS